MVVYDSTNVITSNMWQADPGQYGSPDDIHSGNGAEFTAMSVREWLLRLDVQTWFIEPGSL